MDPEDETKKPSSMKLFSRAGLWLFFYMCMLTFIANFPSAFTHTSINTAVLQMNQYLNESYLERDIYLEAHDVSLIKSVVNCIWYIGQVGGALSSPTICDRYGRKAAFLISVIAVTVGTLIQYISLYSIYPEIFLVGRILTAVASPLMDAALIIYLNECSPPSLRGTMTSLFSTGYAATCLLGMFLGQEAVLGHSLRQLLLVPVISGVLSTLFLLNIPDTPKFLAISKKDAPGALASLAFFQGKRPEHEKEIDLMMSESENMEGKSAIDGTIKSLFVVPHYRSALLLSLCALTLTLPFFPILQNSTYFFTVMGVDKHISQLTSTLLMVVFTVACFISTFSVDHFPRRYLLLGAGWLSLGGLCSFVIFEQLDKTVIALGALYAYVLCYGVGVGPIAWTISPELVPLSHRSAMFCFCYAAHSVLVVITNFLSIPLFDRFASPSFLPLYIIPSGVVLLYLAAALPETKGRETEDIIRILKKDETVVEDNSLIEKY